MRRETNRVLCVRYAKEREIERSERRGAPQLESEIARGQRASTNQKV